MADLNRVLANLKRNVFASPAASDDRSDSDSDSESGGGGAPPPAVRRRLVPLSDEAPAQFTAFSSERDSPLKRASDGTMLLLGSKEGDFEAIYIGAAPILERDYSDFRPLACGSNGCVYEVYSAALQRRLVLKIGNVSPSEEAQHSAAARAQLAPALLDSFGVVAGALDASERFVAFAPGGGAGQRDQRALVMPLLVPLNQYIGRAGVTSDLVDAWQQLIERKFTAALFHGDWHWGNVVLRVDDDERVREMLLIDWDTWVTTDAISEDDNLALLYNDMMFQYSQFATARRAELAQRTQLALQNGLMSYMLRKARTAASGVQSKLLRATRAYVVEALNHASLVDQRELVIGNDALLPYAKRTFVAQPIAYAAERGRYE